MGFLGIGRKEKIIDLSERYRLQKKNAEQIKENERRRSTNSSSQSREPTSSGMFNFFGNTTPTNPSLSTEQNEIIDPDEKKRKLAKRLMDMTDKIEDLSNQIYHLQQRIEVLERKKDVNSDYWNKNIFIVKSIDKFRFKYESLKGGKKW